MKSEIFKYKEYHEAQMANNTGSSVFEIELLFSNVVLCIFCVSLLNSYGLSLQSYLHFAIDFFLIALPITLGVTLLSDVSLVVRAYLTFIVFGITLWTVPKIHIKKVLCNTLSEDKSFITNYRSATNLISALCILAVDFSIFPRRLAKTETFGFGLMDVGVGFFICSNGLVSKNIYSWSQFIKVIQSTSVLIFLGFARLLTVNGTDYHVHTSEYGVHWNFFFTLGLCKSMSFLILLVSPIKKPIFLALVTGIFHQMLLYGGLQHWVLSDTPRDTLITANREGLTTLLGYVSLYYASVALGLIINKITKPLSYQNLLHYLLMISLVTWICTGICYFTIGISRRLVNAGYIFWIIASTTNILIQLILIDVMILCVQKNLKKTIAASCTPFLMNSINSNGLFFFLFANLLTGVINLLSSTFLLDSWSAFSTIIMYMIIICGASCILYTKHWIIKFW